MPLQKIQRQEKLDGPVSVWVAHLSLLGLPGLAAAFLRYGRFSLWYTSASRGGLVIAWVLCRVGILESKARRVDLTRHGERVDDPHSASFQIQATITKFTDQFFATHRSICERPRLRLPMISWFSWSWPVTGIRWREFPWAGW